MSDATATSTGESNVSNQSTSPELPALVVLWSKQDPHRAGEVALIRECAVLGRGPGEANQTRVEFARHRPGAPAQPQPLNEPKISREQLVIDVTGLGLSVRSVGRCALFINDQAVTEGVLSAGDTLRLGGEVVLGCVRRSARPVALRHFKLDWAAEFGRPDRFGLIGESPAAWKLREALGFAAKSGQHVLILGPSGAGKELAASAVHHLSGRAGALVARNAATLPPGLVDAELFGNMRNYPNPGMSERLGLVGDADGGTLFLDEIGELSEELQAHLLRVLDAGEYQRLGETGARRVDLRLVAATNREPTSLKPDLLARFAVTVHVTGLEERREDVPLLAAWLLEQQAQLSPEVAGRFMRETPSGVVPNTSPRLLDQLFRRTYATHTRELKALLWSAMADAESDVVDAAPLAAPADRAATAPLPSPEAARKALADAGGNHTRAARALGLSSRYVLYRLLKKVDA